MQFFKCPCGRNLQKLQVFLMKHVVSRHIGCLPEHVLRMRRSKYMSHEEVEAIVRMQWSATHPQDPYTDDYYHQASQAKADAATPHGRRHFAPSHLREGKATAEPHAFLQVKHEALSSLRHMG